MKAVTNTHPFNLITLMAALTSAPAMAAKEASPLSYAGQIDLALGYDNNVYHAPADDYIDYSKSGFPTITPQTAPSSFTDLGIELTGAYQLANNQSLQLGLDYSGRWHGSNDAESADTRHQNIWTGYNHAWGKKKDPSAALNLRLVSGSHQELYVDRDTGEHMLSTQGVDLSSRYSYRSTTVEGEFERFMENWSYLLGVDWRSYDYEDPIAISQLDNDYYRLKAGIKFRPWSSTKVKLTYSYADRQYLERPSRDELGRLLTRNPARHYSYHSYDASLRQRLSEQWNLNLGFQLDTRSDHYVNYDDYTKTEYRLQALYRHSKNLKGKLTYSLWQRNYSNAFAFDKASQKDKHYSGSSLDFKTTLDLNKMHSVWMDAELNQVDSTDLRYAYNQFMLALGYTFSF